MLYEWISDAGVRIFSSTAGVSLLSFLNLYVKSDTFSLLIFQISKFQDYNRSRHVLLPRAKNMLRIHLFCLVQILFNLV